uniref:15-hydroxyprostaglandin dehydrogenase [NAD(+)] n=2 Tax=Sipha flava TaxID=143950 RepID=A0A2S2RAB1_9HEMI
MTLELRELDESVALVTGGGQGLGFAFVEVLVKNGAYVSLLDINEDNGNKAISRLKTKFETSDKVLFIKCDVTNENEFEDAFKNTIKKFGKINIVINNAGIMTKYITSWEQAIDINFKAVVRGTILGLKYIENKVDNMSAVINIGSITGLSSSILPIYQSTKRAVVEFTKSIGCVYNARENGNHIRIMCICPGPTFDGLDIEGKKKLEHKMKVFITSGEENPDEKRKILVQSSEYIQASFLYVMKNGKTGEVWISENEEPPRLSKLNNFY